MGNLPFATKIYNFANINQHTAYFTSVLVHFHKTPEKIIGFAKNANINTTLHVDFVFIATSFYVDIPEQATPINLKDKYK